MVLILFKIRFKRDDLKVDLKKDFIIVILKSVIYYKIITFLEINKSLTAFTLL